MVTISIVMWNSSDSIADCVQSLLDQKFQDFEILISDNNSTDDSYKVIESFNDSRITLFKLTSNTGFCGGHNNNIRKAQGDVVLLVNPDVIMTLDYLDNVLSVFSIDSKIGTVCGLLLQDAATNIIDSAGMIFKNNFRYKLRYYNDLISTKNLKIEEVDGADGALPIYRREMIRDISIDNSFFDERFFAHKEDWDISWRSKNYGWKTYFTPHAIAYHPRYFKPKKLKLRSQIPAFIKYHAIKNQFLLVMNNYFLPKDLMKLFHFFLREIFVFSYLLCFERTSLKAYGYILKNWKTILGIRKKIISRIKR